MSFRSRVDPVVAGLTASQKRQIVALYGGGQSQSGGRWDPIPVLSQEQIQLVLEEQQNEHRSHPLSPPYGSDERYVYRSQPMTNPTGAGISREMYRNPQPYSMPPGRTERLYSAPNEVHTGPLMYSHQYPSTTQPPLSSSYPSMTQPSSGRVPHPPLSTPYHSTTGHTASVNTAQSLSMEDNYPTDHNYAIMVIGVTGSGKSTACNFFCGQNVFNTKGGAVSVTTKSEAHSCYVLDKKVLLIDTPGFSDAYESEEQRMTDLGKALYYAQEGVHAIVICFNGTARFDLSTESVVNALDQLGTFWPHAFILYTHADDMGSNESEQKQQIFQWLSNPRCPDRLKWLLEHVQYRFVTVESRMKRGDNAYRQQKCREFLGMVEHVYHENHCQLYTNKLFKWAKEKYDKARREKMEQEEMLKNCQQSLSEHQDLLKSFEEQSITATRSQQESIDSLQQEIKSLQQQLQHQTSYSENRNEVYQQLSAKQTIEQEENRKLREMIKEQRDTMELIRQNHDHQMAEEKKLLQLQNQTVMERSVASMKEDMRDMQAENRELKREMRQSQQPQQLAVSHQREDSNPLADIANGVGSVAKGVGKIVNKCSIM
ncbi:uncharacterized protein [Dysidea avara]|uniref:uncharacterized protein n=1 Tax=Dysidea avara TaxID=196820 RepID=UPI00332844B9